MVGQTCRSLPGSWVNCGPYWPGSRVNSGLIGPAAGWISFAYNLQLWGRADKNPYPQDRRAGKDSYPHDSDNQCIIIRLQLSFMMINVQLMLVYLILFYSLISARFCNKYVLIILILFVHIIMLKILKWSSYYFTWILLLEILHFLHLIDRQKIKWKSIYLNLIQGFWLIDMPIVSLMCQNLSCISKLISEWKLYDLISVKSQFENYYHNWKNYN